MESDIAYLMSAYGTEDGGFTFQGKEIEDDDAFQNLLHSYYNKRIVKKQFQAEMEQTMS